MAIAIALAQALAYAAECVQPPVTSLGVRPQATLAYEFLGEWTSDELRCAERAIEAWNEANAAEGGSGVEFVPVPADIAPDITVNRVFFGDKTAGATGGKLFDEDGFIVGFAVQVTADSRLVSSCEGVMKVVAHEFGHGQGLGHPADDNAWSIMGQLGGPDDAADNMPLTPTSCDRESAAAASLAPALGKRL